MIFNLINRKLFLVGIFTAGFLSLLLSSCGLADESPVPTPANSSCANTISVGKMTLIPASMTWTLLTTGNGIGQVARITISGGYPSYQVTSSTFTVVSKTEIPTSLDTPSSVTIDKADAVPITTDPSCTTFVFYLIPVINPIEGSWSDIVVVRDSKGDTVEFTVTVTVKAPA